MMKLTDREEADLASTMTVWGLGALSIAVLGPLRGFLTVTLGMVGGAVYWAIRHLRSGS